MNLSRNVQRLDVFCSTVVFLPGQSGWFCLCEVGQLEGDICLSGVEKGSDSVRYTSFKFL